MNTRGIHQGGQGSQRGGSLSTWEKYLRWYNIDATFFVFLKAPTESMLPFLIYGFLMMISMDTTHLYQSQACITDQSNVIKYFCTLTSGQRSEALISHLINCSYRNIDLSCFKDLSQVSRRNFSDLCLIWVHGSSRQTLISRTDHNLDPICRT